MIGNTLREKNAEWFQNSLLINIATWNSRWNALQRVNKAQLQSVEQKKKRNRQVFVLKIIKEHKFAYVYCHFTVEEFQKENVPPVRQLRQTPRPRSSSPSGRWLVTDDWAHASPKCCTSAETKAAAFIYLIKSLTCKGLIPALWTPVYSD